MNTKMKERVIIARNLTVKFKTIKLTLKKKRKKILPYLGKAKICSQTSISLLNLFQIILTTLDPLPGHRLDPLL
jgi:hypothetical protein